MAMLYAKTTFDKDDCSKLRDILLDPNLCKIKKTDFGYKWPIPDVMNGHILK